MNQKTPSRTRSVRAGAVAGLLALVLVAAGCSRHDAGSASERVLGPEGAASATLAGSAGPIVQSSETPPADIAAVDFMGHILHLWPYTGTSFDGTPSDPINLIFVGRADPRSIRSALLALDGDRTAYGMPDAYPFNATWSDANGDVQTTYSDGEGWVGNVVQLQLGRYEYGRAHLRLFRTGSPFGDGGVWTLGGAHFEILITDTADHQVVSWEIARQLVVVDLMRTGLLDEDAPMAETGMIYSAPTFREIPAIIYNGLPQDLRDLIGGPPAPVGEPVGIASSGTATILNLAESAPIAPGTWNDAFTLTYGQLVPKPICNASGSEYVFLSGPVTFRTAVTVDDTGLLSYGASYSGRLEVTPVDPTTNPPTPLGSPYYANVSMEQGGQLDADAASVQQMVKRIGVGERGAQLYSTKLRVATYGTDSYRETEKCLGPESAAGPMP